MFENTSLLFRGWTFPGIWRRATGRPMVQAGPWTIGSGSDGQGMENAVYWQSMLLSPGDFANVFDKMEPIFVGIGKPGGLAHSR